MAAGVLAERGGDLEALFSWAGSSMVIHEFEHASVLVFDLVPTRLEIGQGGGLKVFGNQNGGMGSDRGITGMALRDAMNLQLKIGRLAG